MKKLLLLGNYFFMCLVWYLAFSIIYGEFNFFKWPVRSQLFLCFIFCMALLDILLWCQVQIMKVNNEPKKN